MSFSKNIRQRVHSRFDGHCAYCGKEIEIKDMQVDHQIPKSLPWLHPDLNPDHISNLFPACRRCNHYKHSHTLDGFRRLMKTLHERIEADYISKVAIDYGIVTIKPFSGKFWFEWKADPHFNETTHAQ